ncbi:MAG: aldo/keto reductase [Myxococcales bacterium]|nr:aldo/keto reductase [Myxococcales bacterium]
MRRAARVTLPSSSSATSAGNRFRSTRARRSARPAALSLIQIYYIIDIDWTDDTRGPISISNPRPSSTKELPVRYKLFGRTGLRVSELSLGTMTFGEDWGWGAGPEACRQILHTYFDAGGNFIDTANHYTNGSAERILGELCKGRRDELVIATKYTLNGRPADPNGGGNHRKSMARALEASLERLGTDYVDIYWVHAWDFLTPVEEVLRGLDDLVRQGKVLYVGISDAPAWVVSRANAIADLRGWSAFAGIQIQYSLIERTSERELLPMARELDLAVTPWSPLGGGVLTGKYNKGAGAAGSRFAEGEWGKAFLTERNLSIAAEVLSIAEQLGASPSQVALSWVRQQPGVVIPILGARKVSQLEDNIGCLEVTLEAEQLQRLDAASKIELGFPYDFLGSPGIRSVVYGETLDRIDDHRGACPFIE